MSTRQPLTQSWPNLAPYLLAALRVVGGFMFVLAGTMKLFAFPMGMPPDGGTASFLSQVWVGGVLEVFGGAFFLVGFRTRSVAFVLSGMMAVAYWQFHGLQSFWPILNGGVPAALYCFVFLYFSAAGPGALAVDGWLARRARARREDGSPARLADQAIPSR